QRTTRIVPIVSSVPWRSPQAGLPPPLLLPRSLMPELRVLNAAAQTLIVYVDRIRLDSHKSMRPFTGIICNDVSEFESFHASHAVGSLRRVYLRAAPFALTGAHVGQSGLTDRGANKSRVSPSRCARGSAPARLHHRANSAQIFKVRPHAHSHPPPLP